METAGGTSTGPLAGAKGYRFTGAVSLLADIVGRQLASLSRLYLPTGPTAALVKHVFDTLTCESLDRPITPPFEGLSRINADGLPFQWVFRFDGGRPGWGFLCEAGRPGTSAPARYALTRERIDASSAAIGGTLPGFLDSVAARLMPAADEPWPSHWRSGIWVGVAVHDHALRIKPYFNLNRGSARDRWLRVGWVLKDLGRAAALERLCALSSHCSQDSWPAGLAVDVDPDGSAGRVKVYFRSAAVAPGWLKRWYEALGLDAHASSVRRLLDLCGRTGPAPYPPSGLVVSVEIHADERMSLKTDLSITKWMASDARIVEACAALVGALNLQAGHLTEALRAIGAWPPCPDGCAEMRFVGLGCEPDGSQHVNVYVAAPVSVRSPRARRKRDGGAESTRNAVERGVGFLLGSRQDGHWKDFLLPVGTSDAWVTAYVLANIAGTPGGLLDPERKALTDALDWLASAQKADGGWGYHGGVPSDADSTAWALLAHRALRRSAPHKALAFLDACRLDEGVGTYPAETSPAPGWARAVPDVTALALQAGAFESSAASGRLFQWALSDGLIPAYWWASRLYTCAMLPGRPPQPQLATLRRTLTKFQAAGSFERALLLRCRVKLGLPVGTMVRELVETQNADGSWAPSALLRLTRPEVARPWAVIDAGPLYLDLRGIFTTATAVAAVGRVLVSRMPLTNADRSP